MVAILKEIPSENRYKVILNYGTNSEITHYFNNYKDAFVFHAKQSDKNNKAGITLTGNASIKINGMDIDSLEGREGITIEENNKSIKIEV